MTGGTNAIEVRGLTKTYRTKIERGRAEGGKKERGKKEGVFEAVRGIDLHVAEGEVLAFLGANGAGKTTTIEILEGFRTRDDGFVRVLGEDPATAPRSWRNGLGIVLQESEPDAVLTARELVTQYATYYQSPRPIDEVLELVGLSDHANQRNKVLSGGQKRRLDLAIALIGDPRLVFLDEPTTGFDPSARREAWEMIENLRALGTTVLLTTHYMDEAEHLADRIVVVTNGRVTAEGTAAELADSVSLRTRISWDPAELAIDRLPAALRAETTDEGERLLIETDDVAAIVHSLTAAAVQAATPLSSLSVAKPDLESSFLRLTEADR